LVLTSRKAFPHRARRPIIGPVSSTTRRPPPVRALTLMCLASCLLAVVGVVAPMSPEAPRELNAGAAVLAAALAGFVWWRPGPAVLRLGVLAHVAGLSVMVAGAATDVGAVAGALGYVWVSLYAAFFLGRATARGCSALVSVGLAAALLADPFLGALQVWLLVTATTVLAVEVVGRVVQKLALAAMVDPLTGALNRSGLAQASTPALAHAARTGEPLTVAVLDLDGFKAVNDREGHAAGDALLVDVVQCWQRELRVSDVLARHGGDEFVLVLPDTSRAQAEQLLDRLRGRSPLSVSVGLAHAVRGDTLDELLLQADQVLYDVKRARPVVVPGQRRPAPAPQTTGAGHLAGASPPAR
jgi:diguanylate cyclase (GGDEF)-like protein